jgi:acetolactate synthase-1/3 small subunit
MTNLLGQSPDTARPASTHPSTTAPAAGPTAGSTIRPLASTPEEIAEMTSRKRHIVSIRLQNEVGALTRVASLFSTRGYNIESLNVAATDDPNMSRLTVVTTGTDAVIQQIVDQSLKLIDVVNVEDVTRDRHIERELLLLKLRVAPGRLDELLGRVRNAGAKILIDHSDSFTLELTDSEARISSFIGEIAGIVEVVEVVRSGALAIQRGAGSLQATGP